MNREEIIQSFIFRNAIQNHSTFGIQKEVLVTLALGKHLSFCSSIWRGRRREGVDFGSVAISVHQYGSMHVYSWLLSWGQKVLQDLEKVIHHDDSKLQPRGLLLLLSRPGGGSHDSR
jgi:hypothetical protein